MKVFTHDYDILVITLSLLASTAAEHTDYCKYIQYDKPDVNDKPELVLKVKFRIKTPKPIREPDVTKIFKYTFLLCHIGDKKDDSKAKSLTSSNPRFHTHKQYFHPLDPRNKENLSQNEEDFGSIQYDPLDHAVYELRDRNLIKVSLNDAEQNTVYDFSGKIFDSFVVDWITKNLYVVVNGYLKLLNLRDTSKYLSNLSYMFFIHNYESLQVFPNEGYLVGKNKTHITRFNMDGSKPLTLHHTSGYIINEIALDYHKKNIYFTESHYDYRRKLEIRYVSLKGGKVKKFVIKNGPNVNCHLWKHLAVDKFYVYRSYFESNRGYTLVRARKKTGVYDKDFKVFSKNDGKSDLVSVNFVNILVLNDAALAKRKLKKHPCKNDNGGCEGFCLPIPRKYRNLSKKCV